MPKYQPNPGPQTHFHERTERELLYGGAAGGGKTLALLMEGTRQADRPTYRAYFFRRTYPQLQDAIDKAKEWFPDNTGGEWKEGEKEWRFLSGAAMRFRHMEHPDDWRQYQGHEMHYVGFDELTQFTQDQYLKLRAWNRSSHRDIRAYTRTGSNPKGIGHAWVKVRFVDHGPYVRVVERHTDPRTKRSFESDRVFIPASVHDNPALMENDPDYLANLLAMPEADRRAFLEGSWDTFEGQFFSEWQPAVHCVPAFEIPAHWRRFGCLDYGFRTPMAFYRKAVSPDGVLFVYDELYRRQLNDIEQAKVIAERCGDDKLDYVVASPDIWHRSGKGEKGQSTAETYQKYYNSMRVRIRASSWADR